MIAFVLHLFHCGLELFCFIRLWRIEAGLEKNTRGLREVRPSKVAHLGLIRTTAKILKNSRESKVNKIMHNFHKTFFFALC